MPSKISPFYYPYKTLDEMDEILETIESDMSLVSAKDIYPLKVMRYSDHTLSDWIYNNYQYLRLTKENVLDMDCICMLEYDWSSKEFSVSFNLDSIESAADDYADIREFAEFAWDEGYLSLTNNNIVIPKTVYLHFKEKHYDILNSIIRIFEYIPLYVKEFPGVNNLTYYTYNKEFAENVLRDNYITTSEHGNNLIELFPDLKNSGMVESYLGSALLSHADIISLLQPWIESGGYIKPYIYYYIMVGDSGFEFSLRRDMFLSPRKP